jgi:hypothetical protein
LLTFGACSRDKAKTNAASSASAVAAPTPSPQSSDQCLTQFDFLVPFQKYGEADLIRAIVVDGDQAFFRTYTEAFRVPLAGGTPTSVNKMPGGLMDSRAWAVGDKFLTQSPGEPIFMAMPKTGGTWTTILDASSEKLGGGRSLPSRLLHDIGKGTHSRAQAAVFDGSFFYWIQEAGGKGGTSFSIRKIALAGGAASTLYESAGELSGLEKAGDRLVFFQKEPQPAKPAKKEKAPPAKGSWSDISLVNQAAPALMSLPMAGGKPEVRVPKIDGSIAVADGPTLYVSGYMDGDLSKGGVFRVSSTGASGPTPTGVRHLTSAGGFVYGDRIALYGIGSLKAPEPGKLPDTAKLILTAPRDGTFAAAACFGSGYGTHAYAMAGKTMLVSVFRQEDRTAGIVRVKLP